MYKKIHIGYSKNTKGKDCIQISADVFGLIEMQHTFLSLANELETFNFSDLQFLDKKKSINLVAYSDAMNIGLRPIANETYEWRVTKEKWNEFRDQLLVMCVDTKEQQIHLESDSAYNSDLQVSFSLK